MREFRNLTVWAHAHALTLAVYRATANFPAAERFALSSQLRRASTSIGANIAEGCGRGGDGEFLRFLRIAAGSASEVEYHLLLARDLAYLAASDFGPLNESTLTLKRMLNSLIAKTLPR